MRRRGLVAAGSWAVRISYDAFGSMWASRFNFSSSCGSPVVRVTQLESHGIWHPAMIWQAFSLCREMINVMRSGPGTQSVMGHVGDSCSRRQVGSMPIGKRSHRFGGL